MPTIRNRVRLAPPPRARLSGGSGGDNGIDKENLMNAIHVTPITPPPSRRETEIKISQVELKLGSKVKSSLCPAPPCPHDFWWAPKQKKQKRQKIEQEDQRQYINIMADRRVVRGPNFAPSFLMDSDPFDKTAEFRRQKALRKIAEHYKCKERNKRNVIGTVPPVAGRVHHDIQTDKYLEELVSRPPALTIDTQTDLFLERPPIPPFKPAKVGIDASTEIGEGELFHFDAEAQPIIEVLVDGAIEQSILEVAHEQEIGALRAQQEEFLAKREAELAELRRLEAEEIRLQAEKDRRLRQDRIAKELDVEMQRAVVAAKLLQGHVSSLLPEIWANLEPASDAAKKDYLLKSLCPWLGNEVKAETKHIQQSRDILTSMIEEIIKERAAIYAGYKEEMPMEGRIVHYADEEEGELEALPEACSCDTETTTTDECPINDKKV